MSKSIPVALQSHYDGKARTTCRLLRITPNVGFAGTPLPDIGMTTTNRAIAYDDGDGSITYSAIGGFVPSKLVVTGDFQVDNAEADILIPAAAVGPMVEAHINAGRYDFATFSLYRVNYNDLTAGRHEVVMHGTIGQMRIVNGLAVVAELRPMMQPYRQPGVCKLDSITCRQQLGGPLCGVDLAPLWVTGTVTSVGAEPDRIFTDSARAEANGYFAPGVVEWTGGNNEGRSYEVEAYTSDTAYLTFPTMFDIEVGDTYRMRKDCNKQARDADKGCKFFWDTAWGLHFDGEPDIPIGEEAALNTPNAGSPSPNRRRPVDDVYNPPPEFDEIYPVDNGGFESGDLTDWTEVAGIGGWSVEATDPGEGTYRLRYDPVAGGTATGNIRSAWAPFVHNDVLTFSCLAKLGFSTTDTAYGAGINCITANATTGGAVSRSASWVRIGFSGAHRQDAAATQVAVLLTAYTNGTDPVYFDDVRLQVG